MYLYICLIRQQPKNIIKFRIIRNNYSGKKRNLNLFRFYYKLLRANGGCLDCKRRRRTYQAAISLGELPKSFDPRISEWGNPAYRDICYPAGSEPGEVKHLSSQRKRNQMRFPQQRRANWDQDKPNACIGGCRTII